ncbi:MAG: hypothetical protein NW208_01350 [Bryobacter sp.]|nr:hypothetical protein [Bryobacter sp.]
MLRAILTFEAMLKKPQSQLQVLRKHSIALLLIAWVGMRLWSLYRYSGYSLGAWKWVVSELLVLVVLFWVGTVVTRRVNLGNPLSSLQLAVFFSLGSPMLDLVQQSWARSRSTSDMLLLAGTFALILAMPGVIIILRDEAAASERPILLFGAREQENNS